MKFELSKKYLLIPVLIFFLLSFFSLIFFFFTIIIYISLILRIKFTKIIIENNSLFYEDGIIFKVKKEIPISKINNIEVNQNSLQSYLNVGDIKIFTGNDYPLSIFNIENFSVFIQQINQVK